jgi:hypothetical protein
MSHALPSYSKPAAASPAIAAVFARTRRPSKYGSRVSPKGILYDPKILGATPPWSTTLIFDEYDLASPEFDLMVETAVNAAVDRWPAVTRKVEFVKRGKGQGRSFLRFGKGRVWLPFRSAANHAIFIDLRKTDDPDKNVRAPEVIGRNGRPTKDPREIYSGVRARVSIGVQTYAGKGDKGVSFGLNNVQKLGDAPHIAAGSIGEASRCI